MGRIALFIFSLGFFIHSYASTDAIAYSEIPGNVVIQGQGAYDQLKELSKHETILQVIFGRDCYSQALLQVDRKCNQMTTEEKYKLAHAMNICFLVSNGHMGYKCSDRMTPSECSKNLDDRAFSSYNMFFANIHSICLYVSNREFEWHTSQLLNKLYEGAGAAQSVLHGIVQGLQVHQEQQLLLQEGMLQMREEQSGLARGLREGLQRLTTIQGQADVLQEQVNKTLVMEEEVSRRQRDLARQVVALEDLEQRHAAAAEMRWEQLLQRASHMEERQVHYEALQEALAASSGQLLQQSGQLQGAIETVLAAQQRTSSLLGRVLGGQWTLKDIAFYAASAASVLLLTSPTNLQQSRLPLLALLFTTAACERALRQYMQIWLPLLEGAMGLPPATPFIGNMEQAGWALRILSGVTACVLLMRRLLTIRRRDAEDQRVLAGIQLKLDQLVSQQMLLTRHLLGNDPLTSPVISPDGQDQAQKRLPTPHLPCQVTLPCIPTLKAIATQSDSLAAKPTVPEHGQGEASRWAASGLHAVCTASHLDSNYQAMDKERQRPADPGLWQHQLAIFAVTPAVEQHFHPGPAPSTSTGAAQEHELQVQHADRDNRVNTAKKGQNRSKRKHESQSDDAQHQERSARVKARRGQGKS
ncbi:hypothetical protein VaNZ11_004027 [Volvox africanus]|uniref:Uncharacterized protein n=1 Tax=Volvox africanus TaxID=51714 RepID=A0ABQ5RWQ2_9CHLO|nr:hypothetical protein VaNZ11_004027 [Volvox africanus]